MPQQPGTQASVLDQPHHPHRPRTIDRAQIAFSRLAVDLDLDHRRRQHRALPRHRRDLARAEFDAPWGRPTS